MLRPRVMPCLLISGSGLVKTAKFKDAQYVGDPINAARIFNEIGVDELVIYDINATSLGQRVQMGLLESVVSECFMPVTYGGGVKSVEDFRRLYYLGVEKISVSAALFQSPDMVRSAIKKFGSQSVVATLDIRWSKLKRKYVVCTHRGKRIVPLTLEQVLETLTDLRVGEVVIHHIDREGTWKGFDCGLISRVASQTEAPVVAVGGAGTMEHIREAVDCGASAVGVGSMAVFQAHGMGVLINFPSLRELEDLLS